MSSFQSTILSSLQTSLEAQKELLKANARLDHAVQNSKANGLPPIAVAPAQGAFLSILCQMLNAQNVLEIGTLGGYSTIWFAESSPDVKVTSIEYNPKHREVAIQNTQGQSLTNVDIRLGAALDVLPKLAEEGTIFDFVFIDADWEHQKDYFDWAVKLTRKGGCIYVDNAVRQITESDVSDPLRMALIEHVKANQQVNATLIPTLSTHKAADIELVDGFVVAIVK